MSRDIASERLSLADLDTFRTVANVLNFREAARQLGVSQSAVTQAIARLEARLEARLFRRTTRAVALTPDGDALRIYASAMAKIADETRQHFQSGGRRQLRLGIVEDFAIAGMHRLLLLLIQEEPNLGVLIRTGLSTSLRRMLDDGEIDMALIKRRSGSLCGPVLGSRALVWVGQPNRFTREEIVPIVIYPEPSETRDAVLSALRDAGRKWAIVGESEGVTGLSAAITAGLGVGAFSQGLMPPELVELQPEGLPSLPKLDYVMLTIATGAIVGAAEVIIAELAKEMLSS